MSGLLHAVLIFAAAAAGAALLSLAASLLSIRRLSGNRPRQTRLPPVSVLVPARNEERDIEAAVGSLIAQEYPDLEVIVVDDRSTDATAAILARLSESSPRLRVIRGEEPPPGWLGKPHALWQAYRAASGELLLFVDADVRYGPRAVDDAVRFLESDRADLLALLPRLEARGFWENVLMPYLLVSIFFGPGWLAERDRFRWIAAGGGAGNLVRRRAYESAGGHAAIRDSVIDDIRLALTLKRAGFRVRIARAEDAVAVRMYRGFREVWDGFTKNVAYAFEGPLGVVLGLLTSAMTVAMIVPPVVLAAALAGAAVPPPDLRLAAGATGGYLLARAILAAALKDPVWPALANPVMALVWDALIVRSLYRRFIRRRLVWRGREFDARAARF